jgi:cytoskeletal protein RodZ
MNEFLRKFSAQLKTLREEKKISLDQINNKTRIDKKFLEAIEEGNFSLMPEVYMKAFLKEYSIALDIDPNVTIEKYERAKQGQNIDEEIKDEDIKSEQKIILKNNTIEDETSAGPNKEVIKIAESSNKIWYYILVAIALIFIIFAIYNSFLKKPNEIIVTEKPFEETLPQNEVAGLTSKDLNTNSKQSNQKSLDVNDANSIAVKDYEQIQNNTNKLTLKITADDNAWIRIIVDEKDNIEFIMTKNMVKTFTADKQFFLHIGNSGAVKLFLNNKELEFNKAPNKVRKIIVNKNGVQYIRRTTPVTNEG